MSERTFKLTKAPFEWRAVTTLTKEELEAVPVIADRYAKNAAFFKWSEADELYIFAEVVVGRPTKRKEWVASLQVIVHHPRGAAWLSTSVSQSFKGKGCFLKAFDDLYFKVWEESSYLKDWMPLEWLSPEGQTERREKIRQACLGLIGSVPDVFVPPMVIVMTQKQIEALAEAEEEGNG